MLYELTTYATTYDTRWNVDHADALDVRVVESDPITDQGNPPLHLMMWAHHYVAAPFLAEHPELSAVTVEVCAYWPARIDHNDGGQSAHVHHLDAMTAATRAREEVGA